MIVVSDGRPERLRHRLIPRGDASRSRQHSNNASVRLTLQEHDVMEWIYAAWADGSIYFMLLAALFIVNLLPPVPAEMLIPFSATLFADRAFNMPIAIVMGTAGLVLGTIPLYYLGRRLGEARCKRFLVRYQRWLAITPADIDRFGQWFCRYGRVLVMLGRCIPGMRSMVSIPAGFHRMRFAPFLFWTTLGSQRSGRPCC